MSSVTYQNDTYATLADVQAKLTQEQDYPDNEITAALSYATALIDARTGTHFGIITQQMIYDVRTDSAVLNTSGTVTSVSIGATVLPSTSYQVMPWGIRFYAPTGGAWINTAHPYTVEPVRSWWGSGGRGVTLTVNGSFGEPVNPLIKKATVLLAIDELTEGEVETSSIIGDLPNDVRSFSVEGLSVTLAGQIDASGATSTGNSTADRLVDLTVGKRAFVL